MPTEPDDGPRLADLLDKLNGRESKVEHYLARHTDAVLCIFNCITSDGDADRHLSNDASRANDQLHEEGWGSLVETQGQNWQGSRGSCSLHVEDGPPEPREVCTPRGNVTVHRSYAHYLAAEDKVAWFREAFIKAMTMRAEALGLSIPSGAPRE